jgi:AcrR family transcriptional regulator
MASREGDAVIAMAVESGRSNQKLRTRRALVEATQTLIRTGREVSMPEIARAALVSEATAYRYFPDLLSLLREGFAALLPVPAEALAPVAESRDPVDRVAFAAVFYFRHVLSIQGAIRTMISATITRPELAAVLPGLQVPLIDLALAPLEAELSVSDPTALAQLKRDLAVVVSAEALFSLTDRYGLDPEEAITSAVHAATTVTASALPRSTRRHEDDKGVRHDARDRPRHVRSHPKK